MDEEASLDAGDEVGFHALDVEVLFGDAILSSSLPKVLLTKLMQVYFLLHVLILRQTLINPLLHHFIIHFNSPLT